MLGRSLEISSEAQIAGMRAARPDAFEYEVEAAIEAVHRRRGAASQAYPSIVGSGPNATILHYTENTRQMQAGELLLVDAACAYEYMAGDITRTYPVSGTFTALQKDIYAIVLQAQEEAMKVARAGTPLDRGAQQDGRGGQGRSAQARSDYRHDRRTSIGSGIPTARTITSASTSTTSANARVRWSRAWRS